MGDNTALDFIASVGKKGRRSIVADAMPSCLYEVFEESVSTGHGGAKAVGTPIVKVTTKSRLFRLVKQDLRD